MKNELLKVEHLTKRFGNTVANQDINLEIREGEIISIIGENGAGKSTFCKMLTGLYQPTEGNIYLNGEKVSFKSPADSIRAGINMVYQERNLIGLMTGAQNICFGNEPRKKGLIDQEEIKKRAEEIRNKLDLNLDLSIPVEKLGAGAQQLVEIMRAFISSPKLLILDEPTASLGEGEIEPFLNFIKNIKKTLNISIIFISHKIEEVFDVSDRIAVFTDGSCVLVEDRDQLTQDQCITAMLRSDKMKPIIVPEKDTDKLEPLLQMKDYSDADRTYHVQFEIRRGEIVGFYGLVGSGRTECAEVMTGLRKCRELSYIFDGETITRPTAYSMIVKGMILTPEKRNNAIFRTFSLEDNICNLFLNGALATKRFGFIDVKGCKQFARHVLEKNKVKYQSQLQPISSLSGGNMQKIIIGRSIEVKNIKLLIVDEPTTGMDVGAKNEIYIHLRELADQENLGIAFISSELEELLSVCDRIYVFADGNIVNQFIRKNFSKREILESAIRGCAV